MYPASYCPCESSSSSVHGAVLKYGFKHEMIQFNIAMVSACVKMGRLYICSKANGKQVSQIASLQQFIPHDFDADDHGISGFTKPIFTTFRATAHKMRMARRYCCASSDIIQGSNMRLNWR
ncbi:hypothetical protein AAG906_007401 [Vitis piasezkii]